MANFLDTPPLGLYIHIPWCIKKCPYCDFNSHTSKNEIPEKSYINALLTDLHSEMADVGPRPISSIFIGGGTPSLFHPDSFYTLLEEIRQRYTLSENCEITLEANPGTVEQHRFAGFFQAGINRLSLGIQSFQDKKLTQLGRIHDSSQGQKAIIAAKQAGFDNINIDLMFGLPNQSIHDAMHDLTMALQYETIHLSWYQLTLEPNTVFYRFPPTLPEDDIICDMASQGKKLLEQHGLMQYEVSAYAKKQCLHNLNYWEFGDYIGIGAGAHGKMTDIHRQQVVRQRKIRQPSGYLNSNPNFLAEKNRLSKEDLFFEFMLNALRLENPVNLDVFIKRTGLSKEYIVNKLIPAQEIELLTVNDTECKPTAQGKRFLNSLLELFLPESSVK